MCLPRNTQMQQTIVVTTYYFHNEPSVCCVYRRFYNQSDQRSEWGSGTKVVSSLLSGCLSGYLSSPHVGQEPPYTRDAQHGPVITSPVVPAAASGEHIRH